MFPAAAYQPYWWSVPPQYLPAPVSGLDGVSHCHGYYHSKVVGWLPSLLVQLPQSPVSPAKPCVSSYLQVFLGCPLPVSLSAEAILDSLES